MSKMDLKVDLKKKKQKEKQAAIKPPFRTGIYKPIPLPLIPPKKVRKTLKDVASTADPDPSTTSDNRTDEPVSKAQLRDNPF